MRPLCFFLSCSLGFALSVSAQSTGSTQASPAPGAGAQRWLVTLRDPGFDLEGVRTAVSNRDAERLAGAVAGLDAAAEADQREFAARVRELGGKVLRHYWIYSGCLIEATPAAVERLRGEPRVMSIVPDGTASPLGMPIRTSTNTANHNADAAHAAGITGAGVGLAVLDSGQDSDMDGTGRPHATYYVGGDPTNTTGPGIGGSRLVANVQLGLYGADDVTGHGTSVAAVAAGEKWDDYPSSGRGHAFGATIAGYSIADALSGAANYSTMIAAWQAVVADRLRFNLVVANNSYTGEPDPLHPLNQAFDNVALAADVLPIVSAGNFGAVTTRSQACVNGLAVGAVEKDTRVVWSRSVVGPLPGDAQRFYPDLVANGVEMVLPMRDTEVPGSARLTNGTSYAAPQVAGAATLYRSVRPSAGHLETKAAILATTEDVSSRNPTSTRFSYGLGYLRDDRLVAIASGQGIATGGVLTPAAPTATFTMQVLQGATYSVAIAWDRQVVTSTVWSDLDLAAAMSGAPLAASTSPRNPYERIVFTAPSSGTVTLTVQGIFLETASVPFALAGGEQTRPFTPASVTAFGTGCNGTGTAESVGVPLPAAAANAMGNGADATGIFGYSTYAPVYRGQQVFDPAQIPAPLVIRGIAIRQDDAGRSLTSPWWAELSVDAVHTTVTPRTMTASYSGNRTGPGTTVIAPRRIDVPAWTGTNNDPNAWFVIPFDQPFLYAPQAGETLLLDFFRTGTTERDFQLLNRFSIDAVDDVINMPASSFTSTSGLARGHGVVIGLVTGQPNAVPRLRADGLVATGSTFALTLDQILPGAAAAMTLGTSNTTFLGGIQLPFDLTPLGAPGCSVLTSSEATIWGFADPFGAVRFDVAVPANPVLAQLLVYSQGLALDPVNTLGLATSNGLTVVLGGHP